MPFSTPAAGAYGTLYVNDATGAYVYVPDDSAIEGLKAQVSESFTLTVTDGSNSGFSNQFVVTAGAPSTVFFQSAPSAQTTDRTDDQSVTDCHVVR